MSTPSLPIRTAGAPIEIPQIGFGTWEVPQDAVGAAVTRALEVGYRHIDTAAVYRNEEGIGEALAQAGVPREELFITTKVWNDKQGRETTKQAMDESLAKLRTDFVDLYLIHWPTPAKDAYVETWETLLELRDAGKARAVGVCNFNRSHLERLQGAGLELPAINQIEVHPYLTQTALREFNASHDIVTENWSPLGARANLLDDPVVREVAQEVGRTPAQAVLRWHLQVGSVVLPRSVTPQRIEENFAITDFELTPDQVQRLSDLNRDGRTGPNPDEFNVGA